LVALQTAIRYPDLLGGLVLAEPVADSLIPETSSRARISLAVREAYKAGVAADPARNPSGAVRAFLDASAGGIPWDLRPAREREMLLANAHTLPSSAAPEPGISCAQLAGIGVPVLLVRGDTTSPRRRLTMDGLAACLPDQAPAIIPGAGHDFPVTHATAFLAAVQQRFGALPH
jgi:pimeloyl-ACP methyl ester carboxylesterase